MSKVLLAEDNHINQLVASQMIEEAGYEVRLASNGREAVDIVSAEEFDLIIMDCQMPVVDGYEAAKEIKAMQAEGKIKKTPIVAFTSRAKEGEREKCIEAGMDDYLPKPVHQGQLMAMLGKWASADMLQSDWQSQGDKKSENVDFSVIKNLQDLMGNSFIDLINTFKLDIGKLIEDMGDALEKGDANKISEIAHTIKSPTAQFGAVKLSAEADSLERNSRANSPEQNAESILKIQDLYNVSVKEIEAYIAV